MRSNRTKLLAAGMVLLAICLGWVGWYYVWPQHLLRQAEQAIAANEFARAEEILQRLHQRDRQNSRVSFLLAQVLRRQHRHDEAEEILRQARQLAHSENEWARELVLNEAAKRFHPQIADALKKLLDDNPNDEEVLQALVKGSIREKNWTQAEEYLNRSIERQPDNVQARFQRGQVRQNRSEDDETQNHDQASADFQEVLRRVPDHFDARLGLAQCLLGDAKVAAAKHEFQTCKQMAPQRIEPLIGLASCALEEQDTERARILLDQAINREPNSLMALVMLGDLCLQRQRYGEAITYFQRILLLDPRHEATHLKLAQAYRSTGKLQEAKNEEEAFQRLRQQALNEKGAPSRSRRNVPAHARN
jgi:tetratricopeptide (TPR) repeat protein